MRMPSSTRGETLGDERISWVLTTDRATHEARNVIMGVVNVIDLNAAWAATLVGNNFVIEIFQFQILHANGSLELRLEVYCFVDSFFVVTNTKDSSGQALLS